MTQGAGLRLGFQGEAPWHFLVLRGAASQASFKRGRQQLQPAGEDASTDVLQTRGAGVRGARSLQVPKAGRSSGRALPHQPRLPQFPLPLGTGGGFASLPGMARGRWGACGGSTSRRIALKGLLSIQESFQRQGCVAPMLTLGKKIHHMCFDF